MDYEDLRISDTWLAACPADIVGLIAKYVRPNIKHSHTVRESILIPGSNNRHDDYIDHLVTVAPNGGLIIGRLNKKFAIVRETVEPYTDLAHLPALNWSLTGQLYACDSDSQSETHFDVNGNVLFSYDSDKPKSVGDRLCTLISEKRCGTSVIDDTFAWCNLSRHSSLVYNYKTENSALRLPMVRPYCIIRMDKYFIIGLYDEDYCDFTVSVVDMEGNVLMKETFKTRSYWPPKMFITPDTEELLVVYPTNNQMDDHKYIIHVFKFGELVYA